MKDNWSSYGDLFVMIDFGGFFEHFRLILLFRQFRYFVTVFLDILLILAESDIKKKFKKITVLFWRAFLKGYLLFVILRGFP